MSESKCPVCGRPVVDIVRHPNGDIEYIHGRYTTFTDFCRENVNKANDGKSARPA